MSHPDPAAAPDLRPIEPGEVWENPVTLERAVLLEAPWCNDTGRAVADLTALPGARVVGEHLHPALHERFTVREGELTVLRDGYARSCAPVSTPISSLVSGTTGSTKVSWTRSSAWRSRRVSGSLT